LTLFAALWWVLTEGRPQAWAVGSVIRLAAPDIALAEAAIGAGLTDALLLAALARLPAGARHPDAPGPIEPRRRLDTVAEEPVGARASIMAPAAELLAKGVSWPRKNTEEHRSACHFYHSVKLRVLP
jgi:hypothetical protein